MKQIIVNVAFTVPEPVRKQVVRWNSQFRTSGFINFDVSMFSDIAHVPHITLCMFPVKVADIPTLFAEIGKCCLATEPIETVITEVYENPTPDSVPVTEVRVDGTGHLRTFHRKILDVVKNFATSYDDIDLGMFSDDAMTPVTLDFVRHHSQVLKDPGLWNPHMSLYVGPPFCVEQSAFRHDLELREIGIFHQGNFGTIRLCLGTFALSGDPRLRPR